ncbi:hypothetical protein ACFL96_05170 [Thermoproteota archaeon]
MTRTVHREVWKLISQDLSVQKDLKRGLINVRALAKHMIAEHGLEASVDAVISAIRRYDFSEGLTVFGQDVDNLLKEISIFTRDHVATLTVDSHSLRHLFKDDKVSKIKSNYRMIKSKQNARIFLNEDEIEMLKGFFPEKAIIAVNKGVAEIRIVFPGGGEYAKGVLSRMLNEIAMRGVAVFDMIQCYPEVMIYVQRERLLEAHHAVLALHDEARKSK